MLSVAVVFYLNIPRMAETLSIIHSLAAYRVPFRFLSHK